MAEEPIRTSLNVVLDDVTVRRPAPPDTYLGVANAMMPGVEQLAAARPCCHLAHALVASHVLECTLKACLSCNGDDRDLKDHALRHNLVELWGKAQQAGLDIPPTPPDWVKILSQIHGHPFYLRYSTDIHGLVTPGTEPMTTDLRTLLDQANEFVRTHRR